MSAMLATLAVGLASFASADTLQWSGSTMGTTYTVKVTGDIDRPKLEKRVERRLAEINQRMSTYIDDSELVLFNRSEAGQWFAVSEETAKVVAASLEISQRTEGAFDVTVGPLVRLWNFGAGGDGQLDAIPERSLIEETLTFVGYEGLEVRLDPPALRKQHARLEVDLSAVAKGYAVDELYRLVRDAGGEQCMVEIGGEVRVTEKSPQGAPWRIGIESPRDDRRDIQAVVHLSDTALASSGDYRNFRWVDGQRYSHTINPQTGYPVEHTLAATTVAAKTCLEADAWATAILVMGPKRGLQWAKENNVAALLLTRDGDQIKQTQSPDFHWEVTVPAEQKPPFNYAGILAITVIIFGIACFGMAAGVLFSNRCLTGTCGGMSGMTDEDGNPICDVCNGE